MEYLAHSAQKDISAQPYVEHVNNVRSRASRYVMEISSYCEEEEVLAQIVDQAACWHDLGKLDSENQNVLMKPESHKHLPINHVDAGVKYLLEKDAPYSALTVYSHHKGLPDFPSEYCRGDNCFRDDNVYVRRKVDLEYATLANLQLNLTGCKEACADPEPKADPSIFHRITLSCLADADHSDTGENYGTSMQDESLVQLRAKERLEILDQYVSSLNSDSERNRLRRKMYDACRNADVTGNFVSCDSPVGSGKTTAVMAHLLKQAIKRNARRIFVVLPYTSIIKQSADVYRNRLVLPGENPDAVVAELHHLADYEDGELRKLTALWKAPIIVTTAVAFFETLSSNRPSALRRLHSLPGSVIFLDEAHAALPLKLIPTAWRWMNIYAKEWNCYWALASGSLVRFWKIRKLTDICPRIPELVDDDLHERLMHFEAGRIQFRWKSKPLSRTELENWVMSVPGPRLLIMNTVQSAAVVAQDLKEYWGRECVEHLSTSLTAEDRARTVERIQQRLRDPSDTNWTLVATSCVEAGVDFSFRVGFRELSSLLSLVQTAGRVSRGGEYPRAEIWSFSMQDDFMLKRNPGIEHSASILKSFFEKDIPIEPGLSTRAIIEELTLYDIDEQERKKLLEMEDNCAFRQMAENFHVIDADTVPVIIDAEVAERLEYGEGDWRLVQRKSVSIARYPLNGWNVKEIGPGLYQWTLGYDDFVGYMSGLIPVLRFQNGDCSI